MADFTALKSAIQTYIKQNGNEEITGDILQEILLSMVTTLGDSAINDLVTALADEVAARQNADGTLQQNITNEATTRSNADTALGGRIDDEATARANEDTALADRLGSTITAENTAADQINAEAEAREVADTSLQNLIDGITENIENGYVYAGIATPSSTPGTGKVFYLALTAGTYTNFGSTVVSQGINILKYNGSAWSLDAFIGIDDELTPGSNNLPKSGNVLENIIKNGSAFDLSAYNAVDGVLATYADLNAALAALNLLPAVYKQPGMSFRFVHTYDNKYVQYRLMAQSFTTTVADWQGVDDEPTADSNNLVKSGGVAERYGSYVEDGIFRWVLADANDKIVLAVKADGSIEWSVGVPTPIKVYIEEKINKLQLTSVPSIVEFLGDYINSAESLEDLLTDLLNEKVDKETDKSLIPTQFIQEIEDENNINVKTDAKGRIFELRKVNGERYDGNGYKVQSGVYNPIVPKRLEVEEPFSSALCVDGDYCYGGHQAQINVTKYKFGRYTRPEAIGNGCNASKSGVTGRVRTIACKGNYLYVSMRGNGYAFWETDSKKAEFRALWDNKNVMSDVFTNYSHTGTSSIIYDESVSSPGRGMGCCKMIGGGDAYLSASKNITIGDIALFFKFGGSNTTEVYIPILKQSTEDILGLVIDAQGKLGLKVNGVNTMSDYTIGTNWINIKIRISSNTVELYVRSQECETSSWSKIVTANDSVSADTICIGIDTTNNVTVYVDDLEYNPTDIEAVSYNAGRIAIIDKNTMTLVKAYDVNIRCHDIVIDGNILYLGLNGGLNIYQIANNLQSLTLICSYRYSDLWCLNRYWAIEIQGIAYFSANNRKYIAATNYRYGLTIIDVTDPTDAKFVKRYDDIPKYGSRGSYGEYHEWGVVVDYPYVYTTIGANHGVINDNQTLPIGMKLITGVKVRDITDMYSPKTRLVTVPESLNPYPNAGDPLPISITKMADKLMLGYGDKGIAVFQADGLNTQYLYNAVPSYSSNTKFLSNSYGFVYIADGEKYNSDNSINISNLNFSIIMDNCLLTKLKGTFENDMPYYKKVRIVGNQTDVGGDYADNPYIGLRGTFTITSDSITSIKDGSGTEHSLPFTTSSQSNDYNIRALQGETLDVLIEGETTHIRGVRCTMLGNYISLLQFPSLELVNWTKAAFNTSFLKDNVSIDELYVNKDSADDTTVLIGDAGYLLGTHIETYQIGQNTVAGDISNFANKEYIKFINSPNASNLYGNIESFGECLLLTDLYFVGCAGVYGDINKLAQALYANGKVSGTLKVLANGSLCENTYSGTLSNPLRVVISFTSGGFTMANP